MNNKRKVVSINSAPSSRNRTPELDRLIEKVARRCLQLDEACRVARELHSLLLTNSDTICEETASRLQLVLGDGAGAVNG